MLRDPNNRVLLGVWLVQLLGRILSIRTFMKTSLLKLSLAAGALSLAVASQAITFIASSSGTYVNGPGTYTTTENVVVSTTAPYPAVTTLTFVAAGGAVVNGLATYGTAGADTLVLAFSGTAGGISPITSSGNGIWNYQSGTGAYAGLVGSGTWSATYVFPGTLAFTTFAGDLAPVPEPASMAVLGLGAAALLRRRRK